MMVSLHHGKAPLRQKKSAQSLSKNRQNKIRSSKTHPPSDSSQLLTVSQIFHLSLFKGDTVTLKSDI